ncbi:MAG: hypothetical protein GY805_18785, partial [Chloroflexi bacterium]|nr:hypothetical protein [Chloroflexota bacterium]
LAPLPQTIIISVTRDAALYASASVTPIPSGGGYFYSAWLGPTEWYSWYPEAGDKLWVKQGANTISMTVPTLTAFAETKTDTVYGGAPENASLTIFAYPFDDASNVYTSTATAGGDGTYVGSFTDLHPRDSGYVLYAQDANSRAFIPYATPFLRAQANGYSVSGMAKPYSSVLITVTNSEGEFMDWLDASTGIDGFFEVVRDYNEGDPLLFLESDYQLFASAAGQTFSMTVQNVSVHADKTDSLVWGDTAPNAPVKISRFAGPLQFY